MKSSKLILALRFLKALCRTSLSTGLSFSLIAGLTSQVAHASGYIIGNGDDGSDLEGGKLVKSGILIDTRNKALERVRKLGTQSVEHLGMLIPELEKSDVYLVNRDIAAKTGGDHGPETSKDGKDVYARTFAEPHAATRFFPQALTLNEEQLISLHIHEALHRSLPAAVRENEEIVSKITLAIASSDSNIDRVRHVVTTEIRPTTPSNSEAWAIIPTADGPVYVDIHNGRGDASLATRVQEKPLERASSVTYTYKNFFLPEKDRSNYPIDTLHSLSTLIYPFGSGERAFGVGMDLSYIKTPDQTYMGPLGLSARARIATVNEYDITGFVNLSLNTISSEEIKNSPLGRDVTTLGVSMRRDTSDYYFENSFAVSLDGEAKRKIGNANYTYHYGKVYAATVRGGGKIRNFELGGFAELILADSTKIVGDDSSRDDSGRFRIIGVGPEFAFQKNQFRVATSARWVVDSTPGMNFDDLGDIMGRGLGQGFVSASASLRF